MNLTKLDSMLHRAFNASELIHPKNPLTRLLSPAISLTTQHLSIPERLAQDSLIRVKLEQALSPHDYRILKLYYQRTRDIETALTVVDGLIEPILEQAHIKVHRCNRRFAALCCLSECWQRDLFRVKPYGPARKYHYSILASRRKRRIRETMERIRQEVMEKAERVLLA